MKLVTSQAIELAKNEYIFNVSISTGTSLFEISLDGGAFTEVGDSSLSASGNGRILLPADCEFRATLTGDAEAWINPSR